ncbi:restriction endonuclease subunit S [Verrucomicrobiales bacterium BCK34]|nr:restriction endonuclease subunit S [Verrucomicrobiales bacterium BCK34]
MSVEHLQEVKLGALVRSKRTITYGIVQPGNNTPNGHLLIRSKDYSRGWCSTEKMMRVSDEIEKPYSRSRVAEGDLLITVVGANIGKIAVVPPWLDSANISRSVARISIDPEKSDPRYVRQFLEGGVSRLIWINSLGGAQPVLNLESLRKFSIPAIPLPEQKKIAEILSTWDDALEKLDDLIATKERQKHGLMQQLLTGKKRLPGFGKSWVEKRLGDLFSNRKEAKRSDLPLLSITMALGVVDRDELVKKDSSNADKSKYLRITLGDIGYNTMRMWQGVSALSTLEGIVSPAYTICTPGDGILGEYAAHLFKLPKTISLFHRYSQGLVSDTLNLKYPNFAQIEVTLPDDIKEQQAIASILDTSDQEIALLKKKRDAIDDQKRGLMQQLLTGKVRVKLEDSAA